MNDNTTIHQQIIDTKKVNQQALINYTLHLADNALILGHRNSEWTGHGPILEQDIALSNIALDLIGQSRNLYQYAAEIINQNPSSSSFTCPYNRACTEDDLAYLRDALDFKNCLLVEQPNGDWAKTILRQFFFSAYQYYFYKELINSTDPQLAAIAEKSFKETTYHLRWSSEWIIRLGDGTEESHQRMEKAIEDLWMYTGELFEASPYEIEGAQQGFAVDITSLKLLWNERVNMVFEEATLTVPDTEAKQSGGKEGVHSEQLGFILAEMQFLQRAYPNSTW
jgi:ring-1,2-phenylacetyl-CoA epoxidase subunit PaaC